MAKRYLRLKDIVNLYMEERKISDEDLAKANVLAFYNRLENYGMLYYSKILY
jgi:hypothetical protein